MIGIQGDELEKDPQQGVYIISVAARLAEVHPQTLRMYERRGLLLPERTPKNRRRYSDSDIRRLRRIQELTQIEGLNLSGVRKVLEMEDEISSLRQKVSVLERGMLEMQDRLVRDMQDIKRRVALSKRPPTNVALRRGQIGRDR
jgi:MerR family transcriptional regulator/heat shock protein HspR